MLRSDAGVIEAGADGMHIGRLSVIVLENVRHASVQNTGFARAQARSVLAERRAASTRFHADQSHRHIIAERRKNSGGVRPAAYAGDDIIGQPAFRV